MTSVVNINDVLDGHVTLDIECADRFYLNAYVRHEAPSDPARVKGTSPFGCRSSPLKLGAARSWSRRGR
jgi:hypothetical protein